MERLRTSNFELVQDMESCRKREADMLEFTQKLTAKNVRLQSEFTAVEAKVNFFTIISFEQIIYYNSYLQDHLRIHFHGLPRLLTLQVLNFIECM